MKTRLEKDELWPEKLPNSFTNRVNPTISFIKPIGKTADCGEANPMKKAIEQHFNLQIDSIDWDFNEPGNISDRYDTILCFEVLEHLFNPLLFLNELKKILNKNGVIYLSTPYQCPQIIKAKHHYHEIPSDRITWLFDAAGLKVEGMKKITIAGNWYEHIGGIRPILRYFQKTRLYKLTVR